MPVLHPGQTGLGFLLSAPNPCTAEAPMCAVRMRRLTYPVDECWVRSQVSWMSDWMSGRSGRYVLEGPWVTWALVSSQPATCNVKAIGLFPNRSQLSLLPSESLATRKTGEVAA